MNTIKEIIEMYKIADTKADNVHHTDISGLFDILNDGKLKGKIYKDTLYPEKNELCTLRRNIDRGIKTSRKKMNSISKGASGGISIYLYSNKITSGNPLRGIVKKPIAEFNVSSMKEIKSSLEEIHNFCKNYSSKTLKTALEKFNVESNTSTTSGKINKRGRKFIKDFYDRYSDGSKKYIYAYEDIKKFILQFTSFKKYAVAYREGEDRFIFKKENGIPLSRKFMRIRVEGNFVDNRYVFDKEAFVTKEQAKVFLEKIKKFNSVFVKDNKFNKLVEILTDIEKEN